MTAQPSQPSEWMAIIAAFEAAKGSVEEAGSAASAKAPAAANATARLLAEAIMRKKHRPPAASAAAIEADDPFSGKDAAPVCSACPTELGP